MDVINRCGGVLTIANIKELEYIDRCLKESLRLFPPVHTIARTLTKDLYLS